MYAVIRAGGKQYRVAPGDVIRMETQEDKDGRSNLATCWRFPPMRAAYCPRGRARW